jgi:uncharacterized protein
MKKYICLIILATMTLTPCFSQDSGGNANKDVMYSNDSLGIRVSFPDTWELYTSRENAHDYFKDQFKPGKSKDESPLFIGMQTAETTYTRCITDTSKKSVLDYFRVLHNLNRSGGTSILEAKYVKEKETVYWVFEMVVEDITLQFLELITIRNQHVFRVGFWTYARLYPKHEKAFKTIIRDVQFKEKGKWTTDWNDLFSRAPGKDIDFVTIKGEEEKDTGGEKSKGVCYKIKGKNNTVYLLGSILVGEKDMYPLTDTIENACASTEYLVVELNAGDSETSSTLLQQAVLPDDKTIDTVISPSLYSRLTNKIEDFGLNIEMFAHYKPWFFASVLSIYNLIDLGYMPEYGVDLYFLQKAARAEDGQTIMELESVSQQVKVMESIDQEQFLSFTLMGLEDSREEVNTIIKAWKNGDIKKLEELIFKDEYEKLPYIDRIYDTLYFNRNTRMTSKILTFLKDSRDYFIIIGVGHLIGEKSVITKLANKGYSPELFF